MKVINKYIQPMYEQILVYNYFFSRNYRVGIYLYMILWRHINYFLVSFTYFVNMS